MTQTMIYVIYFIAILFSAILHEIAHGSMAEYFGDYTARDAGRITINPIKHIDPFFTIILPIISGFRIGAAKPVPVDYNNLRNYRWGVFWVSIAGVLTNLFLAFAFSLPLRFLELPTAVSEVFTIVVVVNISLAIINLIPIPPIDGSKILASLIGEDAIDWLMKIESQGLVGTLVMFALIYFLFASSGFQLFVEPIFQFFFRLFGIL